VSPAELWLLNLAVALGATFALWLASLALRNASIVEAWGAVGRLDTVPSKATRAHAPA
jgi:hypothetical protein